MELEDVKLMIRDLIRNQNVSLDILFLYYPAFNDLHTLLSKEEKIKGYLIGNLQGTHTGIRAAKWLIVATNDRLIFLQKSMISPLHHFEITYDSIRSINGKLGWFFGGINLEAESGNIEIFQIGKRDYRFFIECMGDISKLNQPGS